MKKIKIMFLTSLCMSAVQWCSAGEVPIAPWLSLHVIPVVQVMSPTRCSLTDTKIDDVQPKYYVLLSKNTPSFDDNWDVLVTKKSVVQPKIFGVTTIRDVSNRKEAFFMKTIFNALEIMTVDNSWSLTGNKPSLYTRKDYKYFYQPSYVIPPTYVNDKNECFTFVSLLGKKPDYFLALQRRIWPFSTSRIWSNGHKSEFKWVEMSKLAMVTIPDRAETVTVEGMEVNRNLLVAIAEYWAKAATELLQMEHKHQTNVNSQSVARYETDLNEQLAKQAGESWLTFEKAIYFNDTTPEYGVFGLNNTTAPFTMNQNRYASLQAFRIENLATESAEKINEGKDLRLVYDALKKKIEGNQNLKTLLERTGNLPLIYANRVNKNDRFYGIGPDARGENHLGRMLMMIRKNISNPPLYTRVDFGLFHLKRSLSQPQVNDLVATANLLWYRATGRLPLSAELDIKFHASQEPQRSQPSVEEPKKVVDEPPYEGEVIPTTSTGQPATSGVRRRMVAKGAEVVKQVEAPVETPEQKSIRETKERMMKAVLSPKS